MKRKFYQDIIDSGYIHKPLKLDQSHSLEIQQKHSHINEEKIIFSPDCDDYQWQHYGRGTSLIKDGQIVYHSLQTYHSWPKGAPNDGDYTNYGEVGIVIKCNCENFERYNHIYLKIKPICPGMVNPHIMICIKNEGAIKIPDIYNREGYHTINLNNHLWNECYVDISDIPRDGITELKFCTLINGQDRATVNEMKYIISEIKFVDMNFVSKNKGWYPLDNDIIFSHNGYGIHTKKYAIANVGHDTNFEIIDEKSQIVYSSVSKNIESSIGKFSIIDFSDLTEKGKYRIRIGEKVTKEFLIDSFYERWHESIYKALNFIYCERCGYPVLDKHGSCHEDIIATHNNVSLIFNGGWHDAGDLSQQLVQTAEVTLSLFEMCNTVKDDHMLSLRLEEEAHWGLDFIYKTRFGDGYRATSAGITRWSDCKIGNMDDTVCRVHNNAYENFYLSGIEANIANLMTSENRLYDYTKNIAIDDFEFALIEFEKNGFKHEPVFWEHTYNMSESLFLATMIWSACQLYLLTENIEYRDYAQKWADDLLECQEIDGKLLYDSQKLKGFFYRDKTKRVIQHFNHQSREHLYALAISSLIECHIDIVKEDKFLTCLNLYGDYLVYLSKFTDPYPMISSGVYLEDEYKDDISFKKQHLLVDEKAKDDYLKQLYVGKNVGEKMFVKRFPIWFSFRGNNAILLSQARSASLIGKVLHRQDLIEIAEGQLQWIIGFNPFGQSLMYGEGYKYASQYSVLTGEMVGEIPVGIQTYENEDEPYWPQFTNATYKEVWVGLAGKWLDVLSDLYKIEREGKLYGK